MNATSPNILETDLYQLTMAAGYFRRGMAGHVATCELFVRRLPETRRYLVAMGIERLLADLVSLRFTKDDVAFLQSVPALAASFTPELARYLEEFRFTGDVWAMEEGTVHFENEPVLRVRAPIIEAQIIETYLLSIFNHATMVASKAARIVRAAAGRACVEFGSRRTHPTAAVDAARAAYAVGFAGTSNLEAARRYGIPVLGTAAHMWTMAHATEEDAFRGYFEVFPNASILLIDTYDTPRGALRAARVARDKLRGVRLDSGDLGALAREVRAILDAEGAPQAKIVASGDLNEHSIAALVASGAPIDTFGVGTELVCSVDAPALAGVYKLVELDDGVKRRPIAKFSEGKGTFPGPHQVLRVVDEHRALVRDIVALDTEEPLTPTAGDHHELLLTPAIRGGVRVRPPRSLDEIRARVTANLAALPPELHHLGRGGARFSVQPSSRLVHLMNEVRARYAADAAASPSQDPPEK
ncbi:MAG: nicotinate phosphoribosyltransferase [Polyangiaceae bacterium]